MKGLRFINQKLGKRTDRKSRLLKARLETQRPPKRSPRENATSAKKGPSR